MTFKDKPITVISFRQKIMVIRTLTSITAVTAAATKQALAGTRYRARIKAVATRHPCPACSDAAVYAAPVSGGRIHRPCLNLRDSVSPLPAPSQTFLPT